jgi:hypothetical protein
MKKIEPSKYKRLPIAEVKKLIPNWARFNLVQTVLKGRFEFPPIQPNLKWFHSVMSAIRKFPEPTVNSQPATTYTLIASLIPGK